MREAVIKHSTGFVITVAASCTDMGTLPGAFPQPLITHGFFGESKPLPAFSMLSRRDGRGLPNRRQDQQHLQLPVDLYKGKDSAAVSLTCLLPAFDSLDQNLVIFQRKAKATGALGRSQLGLRAALRRIRNLLTKRTCYILRSFGTES